MIHIYLFNLKHPRKGDVFDVLLKRFHTCFIFYSFNNVMFVPALFEKKKKKKKIKNRVHAIPPSRLIVRPCVLRL